MDTTTITKYPCPNPAKRGGCGCPSSSAWCFGYLRAIREEFQAELAKPGPTQGDRYAAAERVSARGNMRANEILQRF